MEHDREILTAIAAGDPAGIAMAYDRYAAALYGYCHWMLQDQAAAAVCVQDTFVLAVAVLSELPGPEKLRPWLFALARKECRRRVRPGPAIRDEGDTQQQADEGRRADAIDDRPADAVGQLTDATVTFRAVGKPVAATYESADATMQFAMVGEPVTPVPELPDATMQFAMVGEPVTPVPGLPDATMQFQVIGPLTDATMQFSMIGQSADATDGLADVSGYLGRAELRALIRSILTDMKLREREVIELVFRHDLPEDELAIALGVPASRAHTLVSRTRDSLEKSFRALSTALAGRQACPVVGELLADWDGQLTEQTRELVAWHIEQCQTCINNAQGTLRPTVLSGLLPPAPLPPDLRAKVLLCCSAISADAVAYRRRIVRRANSTWAALSAQVIRHASWRGIRANPGVAIAAAAIATWVAAAMVVTLLTFGHSHAAHAESLPAAGAPVTHAQVVPTSSAPLSRSPAAARTTASAHASSARPSLTRPAFAPSQVQPSPSPETSRSSSPKPSRSASPKPSKSSSPSSSSSSSPSPSRTTSPSSSPSPTA